MVFARPVSREEVVEGDESLALAVRSKEFDKEKLLHVGSLLGISS